VAAVAIDQRDPGEARLAFGGGLPGARRKIAAGNTLAYFDLEDTALGRKGQALAS